MMPFLVALTTLLWGEAVLEAMTSGAMVAPTSLADLYLTMMGAYAGAGEVQKWLQKYPQNPADDPWFERAQKGGTFVALWMTLLIAVHLWQLYDHTVVMPINLKPITTGLVVIFFAKVASRQVRRSRRGVGGPATGGLDETGDSSAREAILALLGHSPEGLSSSDIGERLPLYSRRHLSRELSELADESLVIPPKNPRAPDARYRLRLSPDAPIEAQKKVG